MIVKPFLVEQWMNAYENEAVYNIAETCVDSLTLRELISMSDNPEEFIKSLYDRKLTYGHIEGSPDFRENISKLYKSMKAENVLVMNGAIGANFLVMYSLVKPGDRVICVHPTYQQLYSVPESLGAEVKLLKLRPENGFQPDIEELKSLINDKTSMIVINNPNNPSGALMEEGILKEIVEIARSCNAYILCDEVYRGLYQEDIYIPSIADMYEKGISTSSMSKVFSLAGLRLGWVTASKEVIEECFSHRDYNTISCGMLDDILAAHALKNYDKVMSRNLKIIRDNLIILDEWVQSEPGITYVKPRAGTTAFLKYSMPIPSDEFCIGLFKMNGAFLTPGKCFDMDGWVRIGYACCSEVLKEGLQRVSEYIKAVK